MYVGLNSINPETLSIVPYYTLRITAVTYGEERLGSMAASTRGREFMLS
jgi:hypothetical protein